MFGIGEVTKNLALITFQMLTGILAGVSVRLSWSSYLVLLLSFGLLLLLLPEPEIKPLEKQQSLGKSFKNLPKRLYIFTFFLCVCAITQTVYQVSLSSIVVTENFGNAATAATISSTATFIAMFAALSFGFIQKYFKNYTITLCVGALETGSVLISLVHMLPMLYFSAGIVGFGIGTMSSSFYMKTAECATDETAPLVSAIQIMFQGFGNFLPNYFLALVSNAFNSDSFRLPVAVGGYISLAIAIGFGLFYFIYNRHHNSETSLV